MLRTPCIEMEKFCFFFLLFIIITDRININRNCVLFNFTKNKCRIKFFNQISFFLFISILIQFSQKNRTKLQKEFNEKKYVEKWNQICIKTIIIIYLEQYEKQGLILEWGHLCRFTLINFYFQCDMYEAGKFDLFIGESGRARD